MMTMQKAWESHTHTPQEGEQVTPDHLDLFILFTGGQALIVVVHNQHLSRPLRAIHSALEGGQGDGLVPLVLSGPRCDPGWGGHRLTRCACSRLTEVGSCTLPLQQWDQEQHSTSANAHSTAQCYCASTCPAPLHNITAQYLC